MRCSPVSVDDLPEKIEQPQYCTLSAAQTALYQAVVQEGLASIEGASETFERQGLVLQLIGALKQICNHPAQYLKAGARDAALSGKAARFVELADEIHDGGDGKALVFTQYRETGELLAEWLAGRHGRRPQFLHGGVPRVERDAMVERFQGDRTERVFILWLKAGGTRLNLTVASSVIHFDLWGNPAVEAQATDRAWRIGQRRAVQAHRFITRATFEERIDEMMRVKREPAELAVGTGEQWIVQLPAGELRALFELGWTLAAPSPRQQPKWQPLDRPSLEVAAATSPPVRAAARWALTSACRRGTAWLNPTATESLLRCLPKFPADVSAWLSARYRDLALTGLRCRATATTA